MRLINFKNISFIISFVLIFQGLSFLLSIPYALYYGESLIPFSFSAFISIFTAIIFYFLSGKKLENNINIREGYILVTSSWRVFIFAGTLPYLISNTITYIVDVIFETTSGLKTTGSSILTDIESLPKSVLFWRSLTHWLGGIGIIVLVIIVLPSFNMGGYKLFSLKSSFL